jgi:4'-phosphopantetheinyl transferase
MTANPWEPARHPPPVLPDEIHVWRIDLERTAATDASLLAPDEADRVARLRFAQHRERFIAGRCALRILLGGYLAIPPGAIRFCYGAQGKPALLPVPGSKTLHFNFSNSGDLGLLAVSRDREPGIDLEMRDRSISVEALARHIFSAGEREAFERLPPQERKPALLAAWTRKEAYLKALGTGFSRALNSFSVAVPADGAPALLQLPDGSGACSPWKFVPLGPHPHYLASLAARGEDWSLRCLDWQPGQP